MNQGRKVKSHTRSRTQSAKTVQLDLEKHKSDQTLNYLLETVANSQRAVFVTGAGISVAAGISDFRSKSSGLFCKISKKYPGLFSSGKEMFDGSIVFSRTENMLAFYEFMTELTVKCSGAKPTCAHKMIAEFGAQNRLMRCYTQNIDGLEGKTTLQIHNFFNDNSQNPTSTSVSNRRSRNAICSSRRTYRSKIKSHPYSDCSSDIEVDIDTGCGFDDVYSPVHNPQAQKRSFGKPTIDEKYGIDNFAISSEIPSTLSKSEHRKYLLQTKKVIPLHGTLENFICTLCRKSYSCKLFQSQLFDNSTNGSTKNPPFVAKKVSSYTDTVDKSTFNNTYKALTDNKSSHYSSYPSSDSEIELGNPCPECKTRSAIREAQGKRNIAVGTLRPTVVLYNEPHMYAEELDLFISNDTKVRPKGKNSQPDLVLIMGTALTTPGCINLIKQLSIAAHSNPKHPGKVIVVNNEPVSHRITGDSGSRCSSSSSTPYIDYEIIGDVQKFSQLIQSEWSKQTSLKHYMSVSKSVASTVSFGAGYSEDTKKSLKRSASKEPSEDISLYGKTRLRPRKVLKTIG
ncbi:NAD-dependent protein deacetylase hst4 [Zancudomyces culisetae]|uniref:NAD-dependent protein deacetylase hst4 n=1 Tax=Zancudomyces culisetae TaxID=1213189 RepID=A0A1R1PU06_ZANCU|nr:NAD-dependent protein deacetylase hst4 [Zancudomyces culisetae]|eukprot:OMH84450.1 NAD-dependent protein deacetylase hst4 [Zancudomyces culisetae]